MHTCIVSKCVLITAMLATVLCNCGIKPQIGEQEKTASISQDELNMFKFKRRIVIQKCYFVAIQDSEGNTLDSNYVFGNKKSAQEQAKLMKSASIREAEEEYRRNVLEGQMSFDELLKGRKNKRQ